MVVGKLVDDFQEGAEGLRVAIGEIGVVEDVPEEYRDTRVLRHPVNGFGIEIQHLVSAQAGTHQLRPTEAGELAGKEPPRAPEFFARGVHVVHELVDQRDRNLLDLALGIGHLTDQNISGCIYPAFCFAIEHG